MELSRWLDSGVTPSCCGGCSRSSGYDRIDRHADRSYAVVAVRPTKCRWWRLIWRKFFGKRRMMRIFDCSSDLRMDVAYDPFSYAQNFDDGLIKSADPDDASRSFSMRFAVPSRVFQKRRE